jgi:DNA-binding transcriptional regulator YhcF (GntR family)
MIRKQTDVVHYLHDHIVGGMHLGHIQPGDRLPSIRKVAALLGRNPRTVEAAYRVLEREGIVDVRGRSGVFAAAQEALNGEVSGEKARWMSTVITEAWRRRIPVPALADEVGRLTRARRVRCVLVEEVEDTIVALAHELKNEWGFEVEVVAPHALADAQPADVFAATAFFASQIHRQVEELGKPLLVLTIHSGLQQAIMRTIAHRPLTVVAADSRFGDRVRAAYAPDAPDRIHIVLARDSNAIARLDPDEPILITRAAMQILGSAPASSIYPHSPTLSADTARALSDIVVRTNGLVAGWHGRI